MNIPAALVALQTRIQLALTTAGLTDVQVFNGPDANRGMAMKAVTIASAFEDDQDAVSYTREERGAGMRVLEDVTVACSVYAGSGDLDMDAHRTVAGQILTAIESAIASDRQLGGAVALARISTAQWMQGVDENGAGVAIGIVINLRFLP